MFKHPELFLSVAPGGSGYGPEKHIQENDGYESEKLRFLPLGYNAWDLAKVYAERKDHPALNILIWDGTKCFNYEHNSTLVQQHSSSQTPKFSKFGGQNLLICLRCLKPNHLRVSQSKLSRHNRYSPPIKSTIHQSYRLR